MPPCHEIAGITHRKLNKTNMITKIGFKTFQTIL